jgi:type II secretory pathway component GspD/PulD (secretin)
VKRASKVMTAALVLLTTIAVTAQDAQQGTGIGGSVAQSKPPSQTPVSLKVSLVFSRYQGDKKISSVPHTLWVTANDPVRTSLRLGTQIPVPTTIIGKDGEKTTQSYNYRDVGTNIDCAATTVPDGYKLSITITDSSVYYPDQSDSAVRSSVSTTGAPAFRNFNSSFVLLLKDGQTAQSTSVTDPVSGQVIKLDATLNVQK